MNKKDEHMDQTSDPCRNILSELTARVGKVRNRLVTEAVLKTLAMGLIALPVYVALYAWLDHRFHLGPILRIIALIILIGGVGLLLLYWARVFTLHISLSRAANYIESNRSYQQQLVAAIEYYEQQADYPYSRGLAEHMIRQVYQESHEEDFVGTVRKWPSFISLMVILCAVACMSFLISNNYRYYSRYFTRLVNPVAKVEPLPPTELSAISGDLIAEPGEGMTLAAAIAGRKPDSGTLFVESETMSDDPNNPGPDQRLTVPVLVATSKENEPVFSAQMSLREKGNYTYYFQAGESKSQQHKIRIAEFPKIQSVTAEVMAANSQWVKPYTEEVKNLSLGVFKGSYVTLKVKTTQPLEDAQITLPDGRQIPGQPQKPDEFIIAFNAKEAGKVEFMLTNNEGLKSRQASVLRLNLKDDQAPEFKLISPTGDYIASNVASVPIEFEVSDDFALRTASLNLEFNSGETIRLPIEGMEPGSKKGRLSFLLELEEYDLDISDSVIFYATAADVDTGIGIANQTICSTPYFVEIRPYRKLIKQPPPSLPSTEKQGAKPPQGHESLMAILEYNRAFLKKTWALAQKEELQKQDKSHLSAISDDVDHAGDQLTMIRDDPEYGFTEEHVKTINGILSDYDQASRTLVKYQPKQAILPEKHGYHEVRALIKELIECPPPTGGMQAETRDKLELKDEVHVTRFEKERIEWQMEKLAQELAELEKEQEKLQAEFVKFMEQQKKNKLDQEVTDAKTWKEKHETEVPRTPPSDKKPGQSDKETSMQGATVNIINPPPSAGGGSAQPNDNPPQKQDQQKESETAKGQSGKQTAQKPKDAQGQGKKGQGSSGQQVTANEMLRIMRAQQKMLQKRLDGLSRQLASVPIPDEKIDTAGTKAKDVRQSAQEHLGKAKEHMDRFDDELANQYYDSDISEKSLARADGHLKSAGSEMNQAGLEMAKEYASLNQQLAMESEDLAKHLEELADAYEKSMSEAEKEKLEKLLEQATALLEAMPEDWWQVVAITDGQSPSDLAPDSSMLENVEVVELEPNPNADNFRQDRQSQSAQTQQGAPQNGSQQGANRGSKSSRTTSGSHQSPALASAAREHAKHFWSVSIQAKKKASRLSESQFSHPEFIDQENRFFEKTATYGARQEQP